MRQIIKIIIIDDHRLFNDGIKTILSGLDNVDVVSQLIDPTLALKEVTTHQPDVVVMDYNMPTLNGIDVSKILLQKFPELKILFLSMYEDLHVIEKFYEAGASGYVPKTASKEIFIEALDTIMNGKKYFPENLFHDKRDSTYNGIKLTKRESEILEKVKEGFTTKQIAEILSISYYTAETHRKNIIVKLGLRGEQELFKYLKRM
jgi:DNA-binding NarL/FixJ family response regulator